MRAISYTYPTLPLSGYLLSSLSPPSNLTTLPALVSYLSLLRYYCKKVPHTCIFSCRDRARALEAEAEALGLARIATLCVNAPYPRLVELLSQVRASSFFAGHAACCLFSSCCLVCFWAPSYFFFTTVAFCIHPHYSSLIPRPPRPPLVCTPW